MTVQGTGGGTPIDIAGFFRGFKPNTDLAGDGPLLMNGSGHISELDATHVALTATLRGLGSNAIAITHTNGDHFDVKIDNLTMHTTGKAVGNVLSFVDDETPGRKVIATRADDGTVTFKPKGLMAGSFDVKAK